MWHLPRSRRALRRISFLLTLIITMKAIWLMSITPSRWSSSISRRFFSASPRDLYLWQRRTHQQHQHSTANTHKLCSLCWTEFLPPKYTHKCLQHICVCVFTAGNQGMHYRLTTTCIKMLHCSVNQTNFGVCLQTLVPVFSPSWWNYKMHSPSADLSIISVGPWSMPMMSRSCATPSRNTSSQNWIWSHSEDRSFSDTTNTKGLSQDTERYQLWRDVFCDEIN